MKSKYVHVVSSYDGSSFTFLIKTRQLDHQQNPNRTDTSCQILRNILLGTREECLGEAGMNVGLNASTVGMSGCLLGLCLIQAGSRSKKSLLFPPC